MIGPLYVVYGGCLRFCGFRPSNPRLPSSLPPSLPLSLPLSLSVYLSVFALSRSLSANSLSLIVARGYIVDLSRRDAVYGSLNDSDAFSRARLYSRYLDFECTFCHARRTVIASEAPCLSLRVPGTSKHASLKIAIPFCRSFAE
jgi:hypothetical protein